MTTVAELVADAELPEAQREDFASQLVDSIELPPGIAIEDEAKIQRRAQQARHGVAGISWSQVERSLVK